MTSSIIPLWPEAKVPLAKVNMDPTNGWLDKRVTGTWLDTAKKHNLGDFLFRGKHNPSLEVHLAPNNTTGAAFIIAPGGAYYFLAPHEGPVIAQYLNKLGIHAFVLRYRLLPDYKYPIPLIDLQRAIRHVRSNSTKFNVDRHKIGILGFSAGGHLCGSAATLFPKLGNTIIGKNISYKDEIDHEDCRPDLTVLVYPALSSIKQLLGAINAKIPDEPEDKIIHEKIFGTSEMNQIINYFSPKENVNDKMCPLFIAHSTKDLLLPTKYHFQPFTNKLRKFNVEFDYVLKDWGGHGMGLTPSWGEPLLSFLKKHSFTEFNLNRTAFEYVGNYSPGSAKL